MEPTNPESAFGQVSAAGPTVEDAATAAATPWVETHVDDEVECDDAAHNQQRATTQSRHAAADAPANPEAAIGQVSAAAPTVEVAATAAAARWVAAHVDDEDECDDAASLPLFLDCSNRLYFRPDVTAESRRDAAEAPANPEAVIGQVSAAVEDAMLEAPIAKSESRGCSRT